MAQQVEYTFGSRKVIAFRNDPDQKWQARLYVNHGETATTTSNQLKTEAGLRKWAAKVLECSPDDISPMPTTPGPIVPPETPRVGRKVLLAEDCIELELFDHQGQSLSGVVIRPKPDSRAPMAALTFAHEQTKAAAYMALCHACCGVDVESPDYQQGLIRFIDAVETEGQ